MEGINAKLRSQHIGLPILQYSFSIQERQLYMRLWGADIPIRQLGKTSRWDSYLSFDAEIDSTYKQPSYICIQALPVLMV